MKRPFASPEQPHLDVDLLSAYLDRQATAAERARVESHLPTCATCQAELESLRRTVLLVAALPRVPVPRAFTLSEAQVGAGRGLRRPAGRPGWYGGLLRGLGAVTALALVAVLTATLVSQPGWTPGGMVARLAPEPVPAATVVEAPIAASEVEGSDAAASQPEAASFSAAATDTTAAAEDTAAAEAEPAGNTAPVQAETLPGPAAEEEVIQAAEEGSDTASEAAMPEAAGTDAGAGAGAEMLTPAESEAAAASLAMESDPAAAATGEVQAFRAMPAEADPAVAAPSEGESMPGSEAAQGDNRLAQAPPPPSAKSGPADAPGRGGGEGLGGAAAPAMLPAEALTPEATPAAAAVSDVLPAGARIAYTDLTSLWAVDRAAGLRKLSEAETSVTPVLSADGSRIAYRVLRDGYAELWTVRWDGSDARQLLDERTLPQENLAPDYTERRIQSAHWIPGQPALAVKLVAVPVPGGMPRTELWRLDAGTGALTFVTDMGRAETPLYAPDGTRFALLEYGTDSEPEGSLRLFSADGREQRVALSFPASPAKPMYEGQVSWLPNSRSLWVAIPSADPVGQTAIQEMNGATLYRIPVNGEATTAGKVDAYQVFWSPDGSKLAYLRAVGEGNTYELYLASADGAQAQLYAPLKEGMFLGWAPDGAHFLYQDAYQVFSGQAGRKPQRLGNMVSVIDPQWVSNRQIISRHDTGTAWLLTLRGLDGAAYGLLPLPREAELDIVSR